MGGNRPGGEGDDAAGELRARRSRIVASLEGAAVSERARAVAELAEADETALAALVDPTLAALLVAPLGSPSRSEQRHAAEALAPLVARAPALAAELDRAVVSPHARMRWGAAFTIGRASQTPPAHVWSAVREAMALDDGDQRWAASELACRLARHHPAVLGELRSAIAHSSAVMRKMALYCLREVRPADLARIGRSALVDPDQGVRLAALAALVDAPGENDERVASARAIAALPSDDPSPGVRRAAAAALGKLGASSPEVSAALDRAAASTDASLARAARYARAKLAGAGS